MGMIFRYDFGTGEHRTPEVGTQKHTDWLIIQDTWALNNGFLDRKWRCDNSLYSGIIRQVMNSRRQNTRHAGITIRFVRGHTRRMSTDLR